MGIPYNQYLKSAEIYKTKQDTTKCFFQSPDTDQGYYLSFAKLRDIRTTLIEEGNKQENIVFGAYIDIFPFVGVPNGKLARKRLEINRAFALSANRNVINNPVLKNFFQGIVKVFGKQRILKWCRARSVKYSCQDHETWCNIFDGDGFEINLTQKSVMGKPKYVPFEGISFPIPENCDAYLQHLYGDYMQIPTAEQIKEKEHTPYIMDLDHSYEEYRKLHPEQFPG